MNEWYGMVIVTDHKVTSSNEIVSLSARAAPTRTRNVMTETRETKKTTRYHTRQSDTIPV